MPAWHFLTVMSVGDAGDNGDVGVIGPTLTLRQAINRANQVAPGDTTWIDFAVPSDTIRIGKQLPQITTNVAILGTCAFPVEEGGPAGLNKVTVARDPSAGNFRLFAIASTSHTIIENLRMTGGDADVGGAIWNRGELEIGGCILTGNRADINGGAVYSGGSSSSLTVVNSVLSYNSADQGGAIYVGSDSAFSITDGWVKKNSAVTRGGGMFIGTYPNNSSTVSGVIVYDNDANEGGGIYSLRSLILTGETDISDNTAFEKGGGVYLMYGTITYEYVWIGENDAPVGDGVYRHNGTNRVVGTVFWYGTPLDDEVVAPPP